MVDDTIVTMMDDTTLPLLLQVILEEFGKFINATVGADMNQRNQYYGIIFDEINKLTDAGKPIKVSLLSSLHACMCRSALTWHLCKCLT